MADLDPSEMTEEQLANAYGGQTGFSYEENKNNFESKFKPAPEPEQQLEDGEMDMEALEHVEALPGLGYEESKERFEANFGPRR